MVSAKVYLPRMRDIGRQDDQKNFFSSFVYFHCIISNFKDFIYPLVVITCNIKKIISTKKAYAINLSRLPHDNTEICPF